MSYENFLPPLHFGNMMLSDDQLAKSGILDPNIHPADRLLRIQKIMQYHSTHEHTRDTFFGDMGALWDGQIGMFFRYPTEREIMLNMFLNTESIV